VVSASGNGGLDLEAYGATTLQEMLTVKSGWALH
jgi:hypothetical protein